MNLPTDNLRFALRQEDPYKLVLLGRDYRPARVASANFLINDGKVSFVVGDVSGVLRLFEYEPTSKCTSLLA